MKYIHFLNNPQTQIANNAMASNAVNIPNGFRITDEAFKVFLQTNDLQNKLQSILSSFAFDDAQTLLDKGREVRELIFSTPLAQEIHEEFSRTYNELSHYYNSESFESALASSFESEDIADLQLQELQEQDEVVHGYELLCKKFQERYASQFTDRAIHYRYIRGYEHFSFTPSLTIRLQHMKLNEAYLHETVA